MSLLDSSDLFDSVTIRFAFQSPVLILIYCLKQLPQPQPPLLLVLVFSTQVHSHGPLPTSGMTLCNTALSVSVHECVPACAYVCVVVPLDRRADVFGRPALPG